jgi:hypothetical protein
MKTWQVWFGEEAVLVDARTAIEANQLAQDAMEVALRPLLAPPIGPITKTECLTLETKA